MYIYQRSSIKVIKFTKKEVEDVFRDYINKELDMVTDHRYKSVSVSCCNSPTGYMLMIEVK